MFSIFNYPKKSCPLDEPICLREEIFEANIGDSININCSIDASPSNCSYLWNVPELHLLRHTDRPRLHPLNESILLYKVNEQLDFGSIKCQATNWIGKSTCEHFVIPKASKLNKLISLLLFVHDGEFDWIVWSDSRGFARIRTPSTPLAARRFSPF